MLTTSPDSSQIKRSFENGAETHFHSCSFFAISLHLNDANYIPLEIYRSGSPSICRTLCLIRYGFERNLAAKNVHPLFFAAGSSRDSTACLNDAYDTPLDLYGVGE